MLMSGIAELVSLGAVIPFLIAISDPKLLMDNEVVMGLVRWLGINNEITIIYLSTFCFIFSAIISMIVRLANLKFNGLLPAAIGADLSLIAYKRTLSQPYSVHLSRNTSDVVAIITTHVSNTVAALTNFLQMTTSAVVALSLITVLMVFDWQVAAAIGLVSASAYVVVARTSRKKLFANARRYSENSKTQIRLIVEGFGSIRDILLDWSQKAYVDAYERIDRPQRQIVAQNNYLSFYPRYILEAIGTISLAAVGLFIILQRRTDAPIVAILGTFALGAQRILPAMQQIYVGWSTMNAQSESIKNVLSLVNQPPLESIQKKIPRAGNFDLHLKNVSFSYDGRKEKEVVKGIDLFIPHGQKIGIIGDTGSGKSTLIDIIIGLLKPTKGTLFLGNVDLHNPTSLKYLRGYQSLISHVPQSIYLTDSPVSQNIAFGVPPSEIDLTRVKDSASKAFISEFIECSGGYDFVVGESGSNLSGGQRQRIGLARAFYKESKFLVLDEATSALDSNTERIVMESIRSASSAITVIIIAHRLSTLEMCDRVISIKNGTIVDDGSPEEVLKEFQK